MFDSLEAQNLMLVWCLEFDTRNHSMRGKLFFSCIHCNMPYLKRTLVRLWDLPDNFCNMGNWHRCYTWVEEEKLDFLILCHLLQSLSFHLGNQHINNDLIKILYFNIVQNINHKNKRMLILFQTVIFTGRGNRKHTSVSTVAGIKSLIQGHSY